MRDNLACEKTFALADGTRPSWILGLNLEPGEDRGRPGQRRPDRAAREDELARLDLREIRYDRVEVDRRGRDGRDRPTPERVIAFTAKREHHAPDPPPRR